jgi:hypothetical protein
MSGETGKLKHPHILYSYPSVTGSNVSIMRHNLLKLNDLVLLQEIR